MLKDRALQLSTHTDRVMNTVYSKGQRDNRAVQYRHCNKYSHWSIQAALFLLKGNRRSYSGHGRAMNFPESGCTSLTMPFGPHFLPQLLPQRNYCWSQKARFLMQTQGSPASRPRLGSGKTMLWIAVVAASGSPPRGEEHGSSPIATNPTSAAPHPGHNHPPDHKNMRSKDFMLSLRLTAMTYSHHHACEWFAFLGAGFRTGF